MMLSNKTTNCGVELILNQDEARWIANSMNEVLHGIHNINTQEVLLVEKCEAKDIHKKIIEQYNAQLWEEANSVFLLEVHEIHVIRRAMLAVMRDFNKYNEYGTRLGVEFEEYLDLLGDINFILENVQVKDR